MNAKNFIASLATKKHPEFSPGDTIAISVRIKEGEKERTQVFEGIVMKMKRGGNTANFTVRKVSFGVGVERTFPFQCANVEKIEVLKRGKVRRAKLFYIRELQGKALRIQDHENQDLTDSSGEGKGSKKSTVSKAAKKGETQEVASAQ
jgi:large subunit ribosomal protein L19